MAGYLPYRCQACNHRFVTGDNGRTDRARNATEREIRKTRAAMQWGRRKREFGLYGIGILLFGIVLYYITRSGL